MTVLRSVEFAYSGEDCPAFLKSEACAAMRPDDRGAVAAAVCALGNASTVTAAEAMGVISLAGFAPDALAPAVRSVFQMLSGWADLQLIARQRSAKRIAESLAHILSA